MSASPGDVVRIRIGADSNTNTTTRIAADTEGNRIVGTYMGPAIVTGNTTIDIKDIDYTIRTGPNYIEETTFGTTPTGPNFVWPGLFQPTKIAVEFRQFVRESNDGPGILTFTEWACKNCDGVVLRRIKETYREKHGKNILFDADSMFWIMDRCKRLEERIEQIEGK